MKDVWKGEYLWNSILQFGIMGSVCAAMINITIGIITFAAFIAIYFAANQAVLKRIYKSALGTNILCVDIYSDRGPSNEYLLPFANKAAISLGQINEDPLWFSKLKKTIIDKMKEENKLIIKDEAILNDLAKKYETHPISLNITKIEMTEEIALKDKEKHKFKTFILLTECPFEEEVKFSKLTLIKDAYEIDTQASKLKLILFFYITSDIPVFYCNYSDLQVENLFDKIDSLSGTTMDQLRIEILTRIIFRYRRFLEMMDLDIDEMEEKIDAYEERVSKLTQEIKIHNKQHWDPSMGVSKLYKIIKPWHLVLLCLGWVAFIILLGVTL